MAKKKKQDTEEKMNIGESKEEITLTEKQKRLRLISDSINKKYNRIIAGPISDPEIQKAIKIEWIPTPSPELNVATGGGFPIGKITTVSGAADSGKTGLLLNTIGYNMKKDPNFTAVWLESESSLELNYISKTFNIDLDRFYYISLQRVDGGEAALNRVEEFIKSGAVNICIINTLKALVPFSEIQKKMEEVDVAMQARMNSKFISKAVSLISENKVALILIQQRTTVIGGYSHGDPTILAGGLRIKYNSMLTMKLRQCNLTDKDPVSKEEGMKIAVTIEKNHCRPRVFPYCKIEYFVIYGQGIENILSTLQIAVEQKIIRRAGAHLYWDYISEETGEVQSFHWTSKNDFRQYMKKHPDLFEILLSKINIEAEPLSEEEVVEIQKRDREEAKAAGIEEMIPDTE